MNPFKDMQSCLNWRHLKGSLAIGMIPALAATAMWIVRVWSTRTATRCMCPSQAMSQLLSHDATTAHEAGTDIAAATATIGRGNARLHQPIVIRVLTGGEIERPQLIPERVPTSAAATTRCVGQVSAEIDHIIGDKIESRHGIGFSQINAGGNKVA